MCRLSRHEFEKGYAERSGVPLAKIRALMIAIRCECGEPICEGRQWVSRDEVDDPMEHIADAVREAVVIESSEPITILCGVP